MRNVDHVMFYERWLEQSLIVWDRAPTTFHCILQWSDIFDRVEHSQNPFFHTQDQCSIIWFTGCGCGCCCCCCCGCCCGCFLFFVCIWLLQRYGNFLQKTLAAQINYHVNRFEDRAVLFFASSHRYASKMVRNFRSKFWKTVRVAMDIYGYLRISKDIYEFWKSVTLMLHHFLFKLHQVCRLEIRHVWPQRNFFSWHKCDAKISLELLEKEGTSPQV